MNLAASKRKESSLGWATGSGWGWRRGGAAFGRDVPHPAVRLGWVPGEMSMNLGPQIFGVEHSCAKLTSMML